MVNAGSSIFWRPPDKTTALDLSMHSQTSHSRGQLEDTYESGLFSIRIHLATEPSRNTPNAQTICGDAFSAAVLLDTGGRIEAIE